MTKKTNAKSAGTDVVPVVEGGLVRAGSMDEIRKQIELLAGFGLPSTAAERYEVVIRDGCRVLRKRDKPIKFILQDSKYNVPATDLQLPSEQFFRRSRPSRYNDEDRATAPSALDVKEAFYG